MPFIVECAYFSVYQRMFIDSIFYIVDSFALEFIRLILFFFFLRCLCLPRKLPRLLVFVLPVDYQGQSQAVVVISSTQLNLQAESSHPPTHQSLSSSLSFGSIGTMMSLISPWEAYCTSPQPNCDWTFSFKSLFPSQRFTFSSLCSHSSWRFRTNDFSM